MASNIYNRDASENECRNIEVVITPYTSEKIIRPNTLSEGQNFTIYNNKNIKCTNCRWIQKPAKTCVICKHRLISGLVLSLDNLYQCKKCNVQIVDENIFHCDKCNSCVAETSSRHICLENRLEQQCPICMEPYKENNDEVIILNCGHDIHHDCYHELIKSTPKCPVCSKLLFSFQKCDEILDGIIEKDLYRVDNLEFTKILCNECNRNSDTIFHHLGLKCTLCGSYNTKLY